MRVASHDALAEALHEALTSLDAVPSVLADAAKTTDQASQQRRLLAYLRRSVDDRLQQQNPIGEMQTLRQALRRAANSASRGLKLRILWLQWRLFWRVARVFIYGLMLLGALAAGVIWTVQNSAWLMEQARSLLTPDPAPSPPDPAVIQPNTGAPTVNQPSVTTPPTAQSTAQANAPSGAAIGFAPQVQATVPSPAISQTAPPSAVQK